MVCPFYTHSLHPWDERYIFTYIYHHLATKCRYKLYQSHGCYGIMVNYLKVVYFAGGTIVSFHSKDPKSDEANLTKKRGATNKEKVGDFFVESNQ